MKKLIEIILSEVFTWMVVGIGLMSLTIFVALIESDNIITLIHVFEYIGAALFMFWGPIFLAFVYKKRTQNRFSKICLSIVCLPTIYILTTAAIYFTYDAFINQADGASLIVSLGFIAGPIKLIPISIAVGFIAGTLDDINQKKLKQ